MKTVALEITVRVPTRDLASAVAAQLGLQVVKLPKIAHSAETRVRRTQADTILTVDSAIDSVIAATNRLDRDQFTSGEANATRSLFEACKQLRRATLESQKINKEISNV